MADSRTLSPTQQLEELIAAARKSEHNFVMMKTKEGVVIEASKTKSVEALTPVAKARGGMAAMSVAGVMKVEGKIINLRSAVEEVPRNLPRLAQRHLKNLGIKFKVLVHLPGGGVIDGDEEGEGEGEGEETKVGEGIVPPAGEGEAPAGGDEGARAALMERLRLLVPQVKAAAEKGMAGAEKLVAAVKAAGTEIANAGFERAGKLLDAVEQGLKAAGGGTAGGTGSATGSGTAGGQDEGQLRAFLEKEFNELKGGLQKVVEQGAGPVARKAQQLGQMFAAELGRDLARARQVLGAMKGFVASELGKLGGGKGQEPTESEGLGDILGSVIEGGKSLVGKIGDSVGEGIDKLRQVGEGVVETIVEGVTTVKEGVEDFVQGVMASPQEKADIAMLDALKVPREDRNRLLEEWKNDPSKARAYKTKLMDDAKVPEDRREALLKLQGSAPEVFLATLEQVRAMDGAGAVDASPLGFQAALETVEATRAEVARKLAALAEANRKAADGIRAAEEAARKVEDARKIATDAAQAVKDYEIPLETLKSLPPDGRLAYQKGMAAIINANEEAKKALAAAEKEAEEARKASERLTGAATTAFDAHAEAVKANAPNEEALEKVRAKKGLLDAVTFGPLGPDGKPPLKGEDRTRLLALFATDARLAEDAIGTARSSRDPSAVAQNAGFVAGKFRDGFADASGKRLDLPPDQLRAMAGNALRMGGEMGPDYFRGFEEYLKSGKQLQPDPSGGLEAPDPDRRKEEVRRKKVAQERTRMLAGAALGDDGTVDFGSDKARGAMDHLLFHPGSLNVFTPQMNLKAAETAQLFADPATRDRAQKTIKDTRNKNPGSAALKDIVGRTTGKGPEGLTDNDCRAAVLSAMMTPLSQGPVGSCFSTAPVRSIRETDPLRAMEEYSRIASTGTFKPAGKPAVPANRRSHEGENPLLRSWEYSVATAAANQENSVQRGRVSKALFRNNDSANNLNAIKDLGGFSDSEWNGGTSLGSGDVAEGMRARLEKAMTQRLKFEYNATAPSGGGGGDGHSTEGRYVLMHGATPINSEDDFKAAMAEIALNVTGFEATSDKGKAITDHVNSPAFITSVKQALGGGTTYEPWKLSSGGFEDSAKKALDGGTPAREGILGKKGTPAPSRTDRTSSILTSLLDKHGDMPGEMHLIGTSGTNAGHAFNALPKHPSMDKIRPPGSGDKIRTELVEPGQRIANGKLPVEQAGRMFQELVQVLIDGDDSPAAKAALRSAMKKVPTAPLTPAEIVAHVKSETRDVMVEAQAREYAATKEPGATVARMEEIRTFYRNRYDKYDAVAVEKGVRKRVQDALRPPEVVVADSNWGGSENQIYFVAAPDPLTGDLVMWKKTEPGGTLELLGQNWEDGPWSWVRE